MIRAGIPSTLLSDPERTGQFSRGCRFAPLGAGGHSRLPTSDTGIPNHQPGSDLQGEAGGEPGHAFAKFRLENSFCPAASTVTGDHIPAPCGAQLPGDGTNTIRGDAPRPGKRVFSQVESTNNRFKRFIGKALLCGREHVQDTGMAASGDHDNPVLLIDHQEEFVGEGVATTRPWRDGYPISPCPSAGGRLGVTGTILSVSELAVCSTVSGTTGS